MEANVIGKVNIGQSTNVSTNWKMMYKCYLYSSSNTILSVKKKLV